MRMCTGIDSVSAGNPVAKTAVTSAPSVKLPEKPEIPKIEVPEELLTPVQRKNIQKTRELMAEYDKSDPAAEYAPTADVILQATEAPSSESVSEESPLELSPLTEITPEQWVEAIAKCNDIMVSSMFGGSEVSLNGNVLTVRSDNQMLLNNAKDEELTRLNGIISQALGFSVSMKIEHKKVSEDKRELSLLERALANARRLGVDVKVTD